MYMYMPSTNTSNPPPTSQKVILQCSILCFLNVMNIHMYIHVYMYLWNIFNTCIISYRPYKPPEATSGSQHVHVHVDGHTTPRHVDGHTTPRHLPPPMRICLCTIFCCPQDKIHA